MTSTKTTLYLPDRLRARLKSLAVARGTTLSSLLAEGGELVLARERGRADREELARKADRAESELRRGLYEGPSIARDVDDLLYGRLRATRRRSR